MIKIYLYHASEHVELGNGGTKVFGTWSWPAEPSNRSNAQGLVRVFFLTAVSWLLDRVGLKKIYILMF